MRSVPPGQVHEQDVADERQVAEDVDHRVSGLEIGGGRAVGGAGVADGVEVDLAAKERLVRGIPDGRVGRDVRVDRRTVAGEEAGVDRVDGGPDLCGVDVHGGTLPGTRS